jgi:hypothetical protein
MGEVARGSCQRQLSVVSCQWQLAVAVVSTIKGCVCSCTASPIHVDVWDNTGLPKPSTISGDLGKLERVCRLSLTL